MSEQGSKTIEEMFTKDVSEDYSRDIWIWGTGNTAEMLQEGIRRWNRLDQIKGYIDGTGKKSGENFYGKPVISPAEAREKKDITVLICTNQINYLDEIKQQIKALGFESWYLLEYFILQDLKEETIKVYDSFEDERSKELYKYLIQCKMRGEYPSADSSLLDVDSGYFSFPEFQKKNDKEIFVDVGCYTADTIEEYLTEKGDHFERIYAFEPDPITFSKAKQNIENLCRQYQINDEKINIFPYGVGEKSEQLTFERFEASEGTGSKFVVGKETGDGEGTRIVALDEFLEDGFTLLKADVESFEYRVLKGASRTISEKRPELAICIYHNVFDFIQIPLLLKQMMPEYRLYLRQYVPSWFDTVVYAI